MKDSLTTWRQRLSNNLFQQFVIIFGVTGLILLVVTLIVLFSVEEEEFVESDRATARISREIIQEGGQLSWGRFIEEVYSAHGGRAHFERLLTIRKTGILYYGDEELEVIFAYKRPGMIRYRLLNERQISITFAFDGRSAWNQLERSLNPLPPRILQGEEALAVARNSRASRHFLEFISEGIRPSLRGFTEVDDLRFIEVEMPPPGEGLFQRFYIDPDTFYVRRHVWSELSADGLDIVLMEVHYDNFKVIEGYPCAHLEVVKINNRELNRFEIERYEINPGILNAYFQPPTIAP